MTTESRALAYAAAVGADVKLNTPKAVSYVFSSAPTPTGDRWKNLLLISGQNTPCTIASPSGTPIDGAVLIVRIDAAAAYTIGYGSAYVGKGGVLTLPNVTIAGKTLVMGFMYKAATSKWELVSISQEV